MTLTSCICGSTFMEDNYVGIDLVSRDSLAVDQALPLVLSPSQQILDVFAWLRRHRRLFVDHLQKRGAILLRDFATGTVEEFHNLISIVFSELLEYRERSSPRSEVAERIYTSTDYPASQHILPHNEHSYSRVVPSKLAFWCHIPAERGGETPLVDTRKVYARIDPSVRDKFQRLGWMYTRNFDKAVGLPWQQVFQTTNRSEVESYCDRSAIQCEWKSDDTMRTRQIRPAIIRHPETSEISWFNHVAFFHVSSLPDVVQSALRREYKEEDLPNNTYYGDGSQIGDDVVEHLRECYQREMITFTWHKRDVLFVDNIVTAHARNAFVGPRRILVALSDPIMRTG